MKLYHFTADWMLESIKKEGLTKGCIPVSINPLKINPGFQWLTLNKDFNQSWCEYSTLPYNRNDWRLTIKIPSSKSCNILPWLKFGEKLAGSEMFKTLTEFGDPENWIVYAGSIKPKWIKKVKINKKLNHEKTR